MVTRCKKERSEYFLYIKCLLVGILEGYTRQFHVIKNVYRRSGKLQTEEGGFCSLRRSTTSEEPTHVKSKCSWRNIYRFNVIKVGEETRVSRSSKKRTTMEILFDVTKKNEKVNTLIGNKYNLINSVLLIPPDIEN